jgi:hypothetical protein
MSMALEPDSHYLERMSKTLTISDELATALEAKRKEAGMPSLDSAAEALLAEAIALNVGSADDLGLSNEALRALIAEGEASGPTVEWDPEADRAEIRRRFAASKAG